MSREVIVHSLDHARAAAAAAAALGVPVVLASAPAAALYAGPGWFKALLDAVAQDHSGTALSAILDCGDAPGSVMAALRIGLKRLRFTGPELVRARLAELAEAQGARLEGAAAEPVLDLLDAPHPEAACRRFLATAP